MKKLHESMPFLLRGLYRIYKWNFKDYWLTRASEKSHFRPHDDLGKLNNNNESQSFHASMRRSTTHDPGKTLCSKPSTDLPFASNPMKMNWNLLMHIWVKMRLCVINLKGILFVVLTCVKDKTYYLGGSLSVQKDVLCELPKEAEGRSLIH